MFKTLFCDTWNISELALSYYQKLHSCSSVMAAGNFTAHFLLEHSINTIISYFCHTSCSYFSFPLSYSWWKRKDFWGTFCLCWFRGSHLCMLCMLLSLECLSHNVEIWRSNVIVCYTSIETLTSNYTIAGIS